ncbi:winged helix-turn-helix transcriptional regulator [Amycolatopsis sp. NPDC051903]|uniref:winged helix-turn-helix transcriptional regulator n=1 Tax=Amycolatopsis sp. NPDC051903 TaxID=3363936 RepID=UPI0037964047
MRYAQHCPVAGAAEVLGEPWTVLIIRELLHGSNSPPQLIRGLPGLSRSLLGRRLHQLSAAGLVTLARSQGTLTRCALTDAGRALEGVIDVLGRWGRRWLPPPTGDVDPELLLLDIARDIDRLGLPASPVSIHFRFAETSRQRWWWLVLSDTAVVATAQDPALPITVRVECTPSALAAIWLGHDSWLDAVKDHAVRLTGNRAAVRSAVAWLGTSRYHRPGEPPR